MGGEGLNWLDQVVPDMVRVGGDSSELNYLEKEADNCGPSKGISGE